MYWLRRAAMQGNPKAQRTYQAVTQQDQMKTLMGVAFLAALMGSSGDAADSSGPDAYDEQHWSNERTNASRRDWGLDPLSGTPPDQ
jgi:hypothetical protein